MVRGTIDGRASEKSALVYRNLVMQCDGTLYRVIHHTVDIALANRKSRRREKLSSLSYSLKLFIHLL